ncbi:MAG TPA: exosortase/archaeosortase family protein [Capsulimonadaceae bacterium]
MATTHSKIAPARINWHDLLPVLVGIVCLLVMARRTLHTWWYEYTAPESYFAHAPLIPVMAAFMLWSGRKKIAELTITPYWPAAWALGTAAALHIFANGQDMEAIMSYSLVLMVWSGILLVLGKEFVKSQWLPIGFLALMVPLPGPVLNDLTHGLQQMSTAGASLALAVLGFENWRTGYELELSNYTLFVDVPCSGFKTLLALLTFNAFFAYMVDGSAKKRIWLFVASLPLALLINVTRISAIAVVGECIGDNAAHAFHDYSGVFTVLLGFAVLFGIARLFGCRKFAGLAIF